MKITAAFALALLTGFVFADTDLIDTDFKEVKWPAGGWVQQTEPAFQPLGAVESADGGLRISAKPGAVAMIRSEKAVAAMPGDVFEFETEVEHVTAGTWVYFRVITYKGSSYAGICQKRMNVRVPGDLKVTVAATEQNGKPFDKAVFAFGVEKNGSVTFEKMEIKKLDAK